MTATKETAAMTATRLADHIAARPDDDADRLLPADDLVDLLRKVAAGTLTAWDPANPPHVPTMKPCRVWIDTDPTPPHGITRPTVIIDTDGRARTVRSVETGGAILLDVGLAH